MASNFLNKIFGSRNARLLKRLNKVVAEITSMEARVEPLSDEELCAKTDEFRERIDNGTSIKKLLPEAFAVVREAGKRALNMRHFDVQLIGGMILNDGKIAEMRTGEGKTLVATLAVYLNALSGRGVHLVTVNDYLAKRDAEWMGKLYNFLGLSVGVIFSGQDSEQKREAYAADITYGTNNEFGFDYLRDNMAFSVEDKVQRDLHFAIVDEVDSILIDEARTPLVISGPAEDSSELYEKINAIAPKLEQQAGEKLEEGEKEGDYYLEEKSKQVFLTELGHQHVEEFLVEVGLLGEDESLYDAANIKLMHHATAALRAHTLFQRNVDYIVKNDEVIIVDEFTGRTMPGRRWSDGLHQAMEAKEGVQVQNENQTLASITFQNFFRLYDKLAGMTGTADTEAPEFQQIYSLEVVVIPTSKVVERKDHADLVFLTPEEKFATIVEDIKDCRKNKQPVLVGTASIETSEYLSGLLDKQNIKHNVLNAKFHQKEAQIIAQAGAPGAITIATSMAGRGTDIVLGGNFEAELAEVEDISEGKRREMTADWEKRHNTVLAAGGLHVVGTERHESRRVDNQLRGRSGRQGDPGSSRFYLSLQDNLMRIFASDRVAGLMQKLGMEEGEAIEHPWVNKAIENAQRKVEGHNFDIRKNLLEYDDVANDQRKVIYGQRAELMEADDVSESIAAMRETIVNDVISTYIPPESLEEMWGVAGLEKAMTDEFMLSMPIQQWLDEDDDLHEETLRKRILEAVEQSYIEKEAMVGKSVLRHFEKAVMLKVLDEQWKDHLGMMDHLRQGIHLRGYAQKNPKQEYKREAFELFSQMLERIKREMVELLSKVQIQAEEDVAAIDEQRRSTAPVSYRHDAIAPATASGEASDEAKATAETEKPFVRESRKVGRNEPCPCGSGKKYKQCHGRLA